MTEDKFKTWQKIALRSAFFGATFAITFALLIGGYFWYESRPKPPNPWDNNAIVAYYDSANTTGELNTLVFHYTIENKTNYDYSIDDIKNILFYANLDREKSLSGGEIDEYLNIDYPIHVPSKHRFSFKINLNYPTDIKSLKSGSTSEEKEKFNKELNDFITNKLKNLNGFTMFDLISRYKIDFPAGWKKENK